MRSTFRLIPFLTLLSGFLIAPAQTICIDPGHPSEVGRGASGKALSEIQAAWRVAVQLEKKLTSKGCHVILTKQTEESFVRNRARAEVANSIKADLMVRLHCDASSGSGFAVYYPATKGKAEGVVGPNKTVILRTKPIAKRFHATLAIALKGKLKDNGLKTDRETAVGKKQGALTGSVFSDVPVVLVEMIVITNPSDEAFLSSDAGVEVMAEALCRATLESIAPHKSEGEQRYP